MKAGMVALNTLRRRVEETNDDFISHTVLIVDTNNTAFIMIDLEL